MNKKELVRLIENIISENINFDKLKTSITKLQNDKIDIQQTFQPEIEKLQTEINWLQDMIQPIIKFESSVQQVIKIKKVNIDFKPIDYNAKLCTINLTMHIKGFDDVVNAMKTEIDVIAKNIFSKLSKIKISLKGNKINVVLRK